MEMTMIKSGSTTSSRCYYSLAASQPKSSYYFNLSYSPPIIFSNNNNCTISTSRSSVVPIQSCKISSSSTAIGGGGRGFGGYWSSKRSSSFRCFSALTPELKTTLDKVVTSNKVVVFMKGNKDFPQCGFSNTVVQILKSLNVPFETLDILENDLLRQSLKLYSNWPTFPQLYIDGEFFGGCDITVEAYKSGELQEVLEKAICS